MTASYGVSLPLIRRVDPRICAEPEMTSTPACFVSWSSTPAIIPDSFFHFLNENWKGERAGKI
jgi:hypothetical protein